tara:strand:- start:2027 stop:2395 length:369 start_codon:yes stop_codon:yes gene_type:complete
MIKWVFHIFNIIFLTLYLYPGSIIGYLVHGNLNIQPQITRDLLVSSNHMYAFSLLSLLGFLSFYENSRKIIISYLILMSFILEISHFIIPNRGFQFTDLFGNIIGIILGLIVFYLFKNWRKR